MWDLICVFYSILKTFAFACYCFCVRKKYFCFRQMDHLDPNVLSINKLIRVNTEMSIKLKIKLRKQTEKKVLLFPQLRTGTAAAYHNQVMS